MQQILQGIAPGGQEHEQGREQQQAQEQMQNGLVRGMVHHRDDDADDVYNIANNVWNSALPKSIDLSAIDASLKDRTISLKDLIAFVQKKFAESEMEGAAIAQVCYQRGIPHLVIRGISDTADEKADKDVNTFQNIALGNAAKVTCKMVDLMTEQQPAGQRRDGK